MKKTFKKLISYICLIVLVFSFAGCSNFVSISESGDSGVYEQVSITMPLRKQMIFCDKGVNLSQEENSLEVLFAGDSLAKELSAEEAAQKVMRSVVAINISNSAYSGSGSGVIVDIRQGADYDPYESGYYIITCHHVISSGGEIQVCVPDMTGKNVGDFGYDTRFVFEGYIGIDKETNDNNAVSLVGGDKDGDIAILKLKVNNKLGPNAIQMATFPDPAKLSVSYAGEVFAIGNPTGELPMTYLHGYISYLDRAITLDGVGKMTNLIQHDCAITHGNSGGGLFNMKGELIGITNAGVVDCPGLSYAIPYYTYGSGNEYGFMYIAEQLIKNNNDYNYGYVEGRWELGVVVTDAESSVKGSTLVVKEIVSKSNAVGIIQTGDYITAMEFLGIKRTITSLADFSQAVYEAKEILRASPSSEIKFTVQRMK